MSSRFLALAGAFAALLLTSVLRSPALAGTTGSITGLVVNQSTGTGIAGATVTCARKSGTTDGSGRYTLSAVPTGTQTVSASASGYAPASVTVTVPRRQTVTAPTIALAPTTGTVMGSVTDATTGSVIGGATVVVSGTALSVTTDATGSYTLINVPAGTPTVQASAPGYQMASQTISVTVGGTTTANFTLAPSTTTGPGSTIHWNGKDWYLLGADYAWWNCGTDFGTGAWGKYTDWTTIASHFAAMHSQGVHTVRWWVFTDGRYSPDFNSDGTVSGLDSSVLPDIDQALQIAANNNIYLLFTVMDHSMWSPASYSGSLQMGGHSAIITNATVQQTYLDNALKPLLQHIAASPNSNYVLGYDIVNEPECNMAGYWGGVNLQASQVQAFVQRCASYIHTYGGGAYATLGSAMPGWASTYKGLGLDFYQIHYYPGFDNGGPAGSGLPTYASLNLDRPCIVGEFATNDVSYGLNDTNALSARWYLDACYGKGYAGALAWSYFVSDSATNWAAFQPVFSNWSQLYNAYAGPQ